MTQTSDDILGSGKHSVFSRAAAIWTCPLVLVLAVVTLITGCGSGDQVATYPVTGEVVFADGSPLQGGSILFNSEQYAELTARGQVGADGSFKLQTYVTGDGAVAGRHQVAILPPKQQSDADEVGFQSPIDIDFASPTRSGILCQVKTEGLNHFRIEVKPPKQRRR